MPAGSNSDRLKALALDLSVALDNDVSRIWMQLNPDLWRRTRNPCAVLQTVSSARLEKIDTDPEFRRLLDEVLRARSAEENAPRWFPEAFPRSKLTTVAYFSMEFMLSESLPIYSGGLGNVAGDQLKAANDLGVPVVGIGLLYAEGYFRQELDRNGEQVALYPFNDPGQLAIQPLRDSEGAWQRFTIPFPGCLLWIRAWEARIGRLRLLLLDTNDPANFPEYRNITSELYGGGPDLRLRQEHVLGIGGWHLLRGLGIQPEVCHLNEGHAALAVLERAASFMQDSGQPFGAALAATRAGNLFTTHTPVEAGFDRFAPDLMRSHFENYCAERLRISFDELMALGRRNPSDAEEPFNMAYLAVRGSGAVNGVSRLHGVVSRHLFQPLFPRWPTPEVPVHHVTNGIHVPTWEQDEARAFWRSHCGPRCWTGGPEVMEKALDGVDDGKIWSLRNTARQLMLKSLRERYQMQVAMQGGSVEEIDAAGKVFDPAILTLGFARRFATYKRPNLLLHDRARLLRILENRDHPVQMVIAGKAHPQDKEGQEMIHEWTEFIRESHPPVIFLSDYDMALTQEFSGGVDVWINTPRRPWEASGTSGMKLLVNGGLNLSELDGWWAEAYAPEVGWALGDGHEHPPSYDAVEANDLYTILEQQVIPEFYNRDATGVPRRWLARIRESMARLTPMYAADRVVRQYTTQYYVPAAEKYSARTGCQCALARQIFDWQQNIERFWSGVRFGPLHVRSEDGHFNFEVAVDLGALSPDAVHVELYAEGSPAVEMHLTHDSVYAAQVEANRNANDFTARVIPHQANASVPLEANQILWQK